MSIVMFIKGSTAPACDSRIFLAANFISPTSYTSTYTSGGVTYYKRTVSIPVALSSGAQAASNNGPLQVKGWFSYPGVGESASAIWLCSVTFLSGTATFNVNTTEENPIGSQFYGISVFGQKPGNIASGNSLGYTPLHLSWDGTTLTATGY